MVSCTVHARSIVLDHSVGSSSEQVCVRPVRLTATTGHSFDFLRMECQIQADLAPVRVQWLLNDAELVQSDRVEMTFVEDLGLAHLTVHQVGPVDSGEYSCVVTGQVIHPATGERVAKTIRSTSQVTITGKPRSRAVPSFPPPFVPPSVVPL